MICYHTTYAGDAIQRDGFRDATGSYLFANIELTGVWLGDSPMDINEGAAGLYSSSYSALTSGFSCGSAARAPCIQGEKPRPPPHIRAVLKDHLDNPYRRRSRCAAIPTVARRLPFKRQDIPASLRASANQNRPRR